ncbi:hypothetical protein ACQ4LE_004473 [Meloidogyne hapla]|uniref:Uncharacterized protein n=1 Tax=Meloidogyne hapla TaxID=6305 RepID=A0A1I8BWW3_MELHA
MSKQITFFALFCSLFSFVSSNLKNNQRIIVESKEYNKNEDGSNKINLLKMDFNKIDEESQQNKVEILLEVNEENENNIYLSPFSYGCPENVQTLVKSKITVENGKKLILFEGNFNEDYRKWISICLKVIEIRAKVITISD